MDIQEKMENEKSPFMRIWPLRTSTSKYSTGPTAAVTLLGRIMLLSTKHQEGDLFSQPKLLHPQLLQPVTQRAEGDAE